MIYRFHTSDRCEAMRLMKATALYSAVWDFDQWLRNKIKYEDKEELQPIRDKLWEFLDESGISFDGEFS